MAERTYFIKASWRNPVQPLSRIHDNYVVQVDLTQPHYEVVNRIREQALGRRSDAEDFIVDFMIPTGED